MKIGTLVAAIAGGIVMFLLGGLSFGFLLADYFMSNTIEYAGLAKKPASLPLIFLFNVVWAWLIAFVLDYAGRSGWAEGAKAGAIVMFVIGLAINLEYEAFMNLHRSMTPMLVHILLLTIMGTISGAVIGLVLGVFNRKPAVV